MDVHELAGKPAPREILINVPRLVAAYYTHRPDPDEPTHRVSFGTSGHRGSSLDSSFNEGHILAICQAICELRRSRNITGPLYMGMDTHALSEPAFASAIEVFGANAMDIVIQRGLGYTPTPAISHAILIYNKGRTAGLADGGEGPPSHLARRRVVGEGGRGAGSDSPPTRAPPRPVARLLWSGGCQRRAGNRH